MSITVSKNVQYLVSLLKNHGIRHFVLSPGARNIPFVHTVEQDSFFTCYSVVDERSAAYFAMGLAQQLNEPVGISCTSSVAASNYLPAITEAYHLRIPLLVLTADRNPYYVNQLENQQIDQVDMYGKVCRRCVNLPIVKTSEDAWYCQRLINEAILELSHHGEGPVQINYPVFSNLTKFVEEELPTTRAIRRFEFGRETDRWGKAAHALSNAKRILVICGAKKPDSQLDNALDSFFKKYNCVISCEHISNIRAESSTDLFLAAQTITVEEFDHYLPEIVITFGGNYVTRFKDLLRGRCGKFEHWLISDSGEICDTLKSLTSIFECSPVEFFETMVKLGTGVNSNHYRNMWNLFCSRIPVHEPEFSNSYAIESLASTLPENSILHTGILNSTRIMQQNPIPRSTTSYCNVGAYGIDGSMSTFLGQASVNDGLAFLVLGDLSFFYDMNALQIRHIKNNVRIMVINNEGGAEFVYFLGGKEKVPTINVHIAAEHKSRVKGWVESRGFKYISANSKSSFDVGLKEFLNPSDSAIVFEVLTDKELDSKILREYYWKCRAAQRFAKIITPKDIDITEPLNSAVNCFSNYMKDDVEV